MYIKKKLLHIDLIDISVSYSFCDPGQLIYFLFYFISLLLNEFLTNIQLLVIVGLCEKRTGNWFMFIKWIK